MFAVFDSPVEIGIVVLVILLLFGGAQLPKLAKNLGQAQKEFKDGIAAGNKTEAEVAKDVAKATPVPQSETEKAAELRVLEQRMAELRGEKPAPRSTDI